MARRHSSEHLLKEIINNASLIFFACLLLLRVPLSHLMGDGGVGYFSGPFELFLLTALLPGVAITKTIRTQMKARINRNQFRNAHLFWVCAFRSGVIYGLLVSGFLAVFSGKLSLSFFKAPGLRISIYLVALCVLLQILSSLYKGYLLGSGFLSHILLSILVEVILTSVFCLLGCKLVLGYGTNVGALLHQESVSFIYGTMGTLAGLLLSQFLIFVFYLVDYIIASADYRRKLASDSGRRNETVPQLVPIFVENALLTSIRSLFFQLPILILQKAYLSSQLATGQAAKAYALWGSYYTKYLILIGLLSTLVVYRIPTHNRRIQSAFDENEGGISIRVERAYLSIALVAFPSTVFSGVLASSYLKALFDGMTTSVEDAISVGCLVIIFYSFGYFAVSLLSKLQFFLESMIAPFVGLIVLLLYVFLNHGAGELGLKECSVALIICYLFVFLISTALLYLRLRFQINMVRVIAKPALLSIISGLVVMVVVKLLPESIPALWIFLPCTIIGIVGFMIGAMLLDLVSEDQLSRLPLGFIFITLGHTLNILD